MPLIRRLHDDRNRRSFGVLPTTLGEQLGAVFDDPRAQPALDMIPRAIEQTGTTEFIPQPFVPQGLTPQQRSRLAERGIATADVPAPPSDLESQETLEKDFPDVKFEGPTSRRTAEILARNKREETIRTDIIARGPQGVVPTMLGFGAALASAAIDPLNVASAFIPIVGVTRFAGMVARLGVTRARIARGALEGAVGNALIEPVVFGLSRQQQLDYTMADALLNITLGGVLGGGLHVAGGRIADVVRAKRAATREAALRAAVVQVVEGRRVDVADVFDADVGAPVRASDAPEGAPRSPRGSEEAETGAPETVVVFDTEGVPQTVEVVARSEAGGVIVRLPDGTEVVVGDRVALEDPLSPEFRTVSRDNQRIADLSDNELAVFERSRRARLDTVVEQGNTNQGVFPQTQRELTAIEAEKTRRAGGEPARPVVEEASVDAVPAAEPVPSLDLVAPTRQRTAADIARSEADPRRDATADFAAADEIEANRAEARKPVDIDKAREEVELQEQLAFAVLRPAEEERISPKVDDLAEPFPATFGPEQMRGMLEAAEADGGFVTAAIRERSPDLPKVENIDDVVEQFILDIRDLFSRKSTDAIMDTPERIALQAEIADDLYRNGGHADPKNNKRTNPKSERRVDLVVGPPAAGKSTVADPLLVEHGAVLIDADEAKIMLPEFDGGRGGGAVHVESTRITETILFRRAAEAGDNIVQPLVGKSLEKLEKLISLYQEFGYTVHLTLVDLPIEKALSRALTRYVRTGRLISPDYIRSIDHLPPRVYDSVKDQADAFRRVSTDVPFGEAHIVIEERAVSQEHDRLGRDRGGRSDQDARKSRPGQEDRQRQFIEAAARASELDRATAARAAVGLPETATPEPLSRSHTARPVAASPIETIVLEDGGQFEVRYEVVEGDTLATSNAADGTPNPDFPELFQNRDRSSVASVAQIRKIATNIKPALMGRSNTPGAGAPIVGPDGAFIRGKALTESGNARVSALSLMYELAEAGGKARNVDAYRGFLVEQGFDVAGMKRPVLVRRRITSMTEAELRSFIVDANVSSTLKLSASEQAATDASKMPDRLLDQYRGGDVMAATNRVFVRDFIDTVVAQPDRGGLITRDGVLSQDGVRRIENALFVRAYDDANLVAALREDPDSNFRAIGRAMIEVAPEWTKLRIAAKNGDVPAELDITDDLLTAISLVRRARRDRSSLRDMIAQTDMITGGATPSQQALIRLMFNNDKLTQATSAQKLAASLDLYAREAQKATAGPSLIENLAPVTSGDLLVLALKRHAGQEGLFAVSDLDPVLRRIDDSANDFIAAIKVGAGCLAA